MYSAVTTTLAALVAWLGRKFGVATTAVLSAVLLTAAFVACINSILQNVLAAMVIPSWIVGSLGMFLPASFSVTLAAIMSSYICRAAYDMAIIKIKMINSAS